MPEALSQDLRDRVVAAVRGGMSCRAAADYYDVSVSSSIRWCQRADEDGHAVAIPTGGDTRSHRIEASGALILQVLKEKPDRTLAEIRECLEEKGFCFSTSALSRFFQRHKITRKKRRLTRRSRTGKTF